MRRAQLIRQLVLDSQYVIDEELVAAAILARAATRGLVGEAMFRNNVRWPQVRSFRHSTQVRSFRPCSLRSSIDGHGAAARRAG